MFFLFKFYFQRISDSHDSSNGFKMENVPVEKITHKISVKGNLENQLYFMNKIET